MAVQLEGVLQSYGAGSAGSLGLEVEPEKMVADASTVGSKVTGLSCELRGSIGR